MKPRVAVIGGGAAGFFGAIACAEANPNARVTIFEAAREPLAKVRISGGGRCNVTTRCTDPLELVKYYPRGEAELRGPFTRFGPSDTWDWFEQRGVPLKTEADGRVFPVSDESASVVECLRTAARKAGVSVVTGRGMRTVRKLEDSSFEIAAPTSEHFDRMLLATGGARTGYDVACSLGHTIVDPVPSLFTFEVQDDRLTDLPGISVDPVQIELDTGSGRTRTVRGPLLITHRGLSGPAVLELSSRAARELAAAGYRADLTVNWLPQLTPAQIEAAFRDRREVAGARKVIGDTCLPLPARLWSRLASAAGIDEQTTWANLTRAQTIAFQYELVASALELKGRGVFKEEFVTCGGVSLKEVDFRSMASRACPGLYLAGEILDVDGLTGGFNFQSAWTTGWIAGRAISELE